MKSRIKKRYLLFSLIGLIFLGISGFVLSQEYLVLQNGVSVTGEVIGIESTTNENGVLYSPKIAYTIDDEDREYLPQWRSSVTTYRIGEEVPLRVLEDKVVIAELNQDYLIMGGLFLLGFIMFITGIVRFVLHVKRYNREVHLKRSGKKISARYYRTDRTSYKLNGQHGTIIYLQEDNGERVFQTHPIFSEFSTKWLETHVFDVYVDPKDPNKYYVDMEKYFGRPVSYK